MRQELTSKQLAELRAETDKRLSGGFMHLRVPTVDALLRAAEERNELREQCDYYKRDLDAIRAAIGDVIGLTELGTVEAVAELRRLSVVRLEQIVALQEIIRNDTTPAGIEVRRYREHVDRLRAQRDALVAAADFLIEDSTADIMSARALEQLEAAIRAAKENQ